MSFQYGNKTQFLRKALTSSIGETLQVTKHRRRRSSNSNSITSLLRWGYCTPYRCRTLTLLLAQMGYGPLCDLCAWCRRTNRRPCCPPMFKSIDLPMDCMAWRFWMMRQLNDCATAAPRCLRPSSGLKELAQTTTTWLPCAAPYRCFMQQMAHEMR